MVPYSRNSLWILVLWLKHSIIFVGCYNAHVIDAIISDGAGNCSWHSTEFYGRRETCNMASSQKSLEGDDMRCVLGDISMRFYAPKKKKWRTTKTPVVDGYISGNSGLLWSAWSALHGIWFHMVKWKGRRAKHTMSVR